MNSTLSPNVVTRIFRGYVQHFNPRSVVVGCDGDSASERLKRMLVNRLIDSNVDVIDIGLVGKEELFYSFSELTADGAIMVSKAVQPDDCNVINLIGKDKQPINSDNGLRDVKHLARKLKAEVDEKVILKGLLQRADCRDRYVDRLLQSIEHSVIAPMRIVVNSKQGAANRVIDELQIRFEQLEIPIEFVKAKFCHQGLITSGCTLEPEIAAQIVQNGADMGIAWDNDFNRCFIFDDQGYYVPSYYIVGFIAETLLRKHPGSTIVHDNVLYWNTLQTIVANGGIAVATKLGRAHFKKQMQESDALYGGESSAYHYFKDFAYCGSGMIPWLLVAELMSVNGKRLSTMVANRVGAFPISGEISVEVTNAKRAAVNLLQYFKNQYSLKELNDGIGLEFEDYENAWRLNLRMSRKRIPVDSQKSTSQGGSAEKQMLKLNVESDADNELVRAKVNEILNILAA